jgi:hypothetical protein
MKFEDIKVLAEAIGIIGSVINGTVLAAATLLLPTVTTSPTFQTYIRLFVIVGGVLGFFFTLTAAAGAGKERCLQLRKRFLWGSLGASVVALFMIVLTEGDLARYVTALATMRDFFLDLAILANLTVGMGAGSAIYLFIGAIVLSWPKVWDAKLG